MFDDEREPAPLAERLDAAAELYGLDLANAIGGVAPDGEDAANLVELVALWSRLVSWAHARRNEAVAALVVQAVAAGSGHAEDAVAVELAMRLATSHRSAATMVKKALMLTGPFWATGEALLRGALDPRKADLIVSALEHRPAPVALAVEDAVLPGAPGRTHAQLARDLNRALVDVDPHEASARHRHARQLRRVCHPKSLPDGMASVFAVLPAEDAISLDLALDGAARAAKAAGDKRTVDQLRADVLASLGADALRRGGFGVPPGARPDGSAAAGKDEASGENRDAGAVSALDPRSAATGADAGTGGDGSNAPGSESPPPWFPVGEVGGVPVRVQVTVPLSTLLGGDAAGELDGYGAIDPATARALALGGTWKRLVTDPLSGTVLDVGRTRYRPPPDLAELVRARDGTCFRPGCGARASGCELDHTVPFGRGPGGGRTALWNLGSACSTDHRLKTVGAFRVRQLAGGVFEWTSRATSLRYRRESDGSITALHPRTGHPLTAPGRERAPDGSTDDAPPPF
ncbi:DUF222 domain-containing protein [Georgenia sp. AZ-5]|uniref:HNH endonuclease signature motif containing protein n=1 Tax=Georgenia sp. AZ-5 TaxID=3367526 RepID=UPI003754E593